MCNVYDFLWASNKCFEASVVKKIRENMLVGQEGKGAFAYADIEVNVQGSVCHDLLYNFEIFGWSHVYPLHMGYQGL